VARRAEIASVVDEIQARMKEFGITLDDLKGGTKKTKTRAPVAANIAILIGRNLVGPGRAPKWLSKRKQRAIKRSISGHR